MRWRHRVGLGIGLAASGVTALAMALNGPPRPDDVAIIHLVSKTKTMCVGRFLIDLPQEAQVELRQARIDGFEIAAFDETEAEFRKRVADREAQIRAIPDRHGGDKNLESVTEVNTNSGLVGKMFLHGRTVEEGTAGNGLGGIERYRYEGISTEALAHANGISIDLSFENRDLKRIDDLPRLVNQVVANPDNHIPTEPGFCIDRVYVRDPLRADQFEQVMMFARLPSHPDVEFRLFVSAGLKPESRGLLERRKAAGGWMSIAQRMRIATWRAAPRQIRGLDGEEPAERVIEENDARGHGFWWEVNGTEDNVLVPHVVLQMYTGNGNRLPVPSSLSDGAALALWDKISSSLRLRANTAAQPRSVPTRSKPAAS